MEKRRLGRTELEISRIVFGCGAVGGVIFGSDEQQAIEAVRRALAHGVNWFDTAASYGDGRSERRLGEILRGLGAEPRVSTKVALKPEELVDARGAVRRSLEASLRRLGRERVDLFQLHNRITGERDAGRGSLGVAEVLDEVAVAFDDLRSEGLIGAAGFTALGDAEALARVIAEGPFQTLQAYFNLLNPTAVLEVPPGFAGASFRQLVLAARERGLGVLNIRVLAAGVLGGRRPPGSGAPLVAGAEAAAELARAAAIRDALGLDEAGLARLALRFALGRPEIDGVLIGFSTPDQVDFAAAALAEGALDASILARLGELYAKPPFAARG